LPFKVLTNNYQLAVAAVTNQTFIRLENGSRYFYSQPDSSPISSFSSSHVEWSTSGYYYGIIFYRYSNESQKWCGFPNDLRKIVLSGIEAIFFAPFGSGWELTKPEIKAMSPVEIRNDNTCVIT